MQYELDVNKYEKISHITNVKEKLWMKTSIINMGIIIIAGILSGRVILLLNQSDSKGIAPIGIAYLIAVITSGDKKNSIMAAIGIIIGYLSISDSISDGYIYIVAAILITIYYSFMVKKRKRVGPAFIITLCSFFIYGFIVNKYEIGVNISLGVLQTLVMVPIYYVIKYAIVSLEEINMDYYFSTEEFISIGLLLCFLVAGIGTINLNNYSIRNILALSLVLAIAYVGGAAYGAMIGVSMGLVVGVASGDIMYSIAFLGIGGLVIGIFKDTGKIFSIFSSIIIYSALSIYCNTLTLKLGIEVLASSIIFLCIPKSVYKGIEIEINPYRKKACLGEAQLNAIKQEFTSKLNELSSVLMVMSKYLISIDDNDSLLIKTKSSALVENLADRSCSNCKNRSLCWQRDFHNTFKYFQLLIQSYENGKAQMPRELERICIKSVNLLRNAEGIVTNYNINEMIKGRLSEGKTLLATHITNISRSLDGLLNDFKREITLDIDLERLIKRIFNKNSIRYNDIFCYVDKNGKMKIRISINNDENADCNEKRIITLLNNEMRMNLCSRDYNVNLKDRINEYIITLEEKPKYYVISYGAIESKDGEKQIGDSYSFGKMNNGNYISILSDGMGSGPEAGEESKATVELVEKLMDAGFDEDITINTVNSIMGMRFAEDEKYATLDLNKIDLYTGESFFIKIGAAPTFIKRGNEVKVINSKNLPFGLVDEVDVEVIRRVLKPGDILVSVSDGVLDVDKFNNDKTTWIEEYLKNINADPRELSEKILDRAKKMSNGRIKDDMTVIASKVYLDV